MFGRSGSALPPDPSRGPTVPVVSQFGPSRLHRGLRPFKRARSPRVHAVRERFGRAIARVDRPGNEPGRGSSLGRGASSSLTEGEERLTARPPSSAGRPKGRVRARRSCGTAGPAKPVPRPVPRRDPEIRTRVLTRVRLGIGAADQRPARRYGAGVGRQETPRVRAIGNDLSLPFQPITVRLSLSTLR